METEAELPEGARVTVVTGEVDACFTLDEEEEREILSALAEEERGDLVDAHDVLAALRQG